MLGEEPHLPRRGECLIRGVTPETRVEGKFESTRWASQHGIGAHQARSRSLRPRARGDGAACG